MKKLFALLVPLSMLGSTVAMDSPHCTAADTTTWMNKSDFLRLAEKLGYASKSFAVTKGNCYALVAAGAEYHETDYFNPVTGAMFVN